MNESHIIEIQATVHGHTFVRHASESPARLLVVFHGYGENAERLVESVVEIPGVSTWHIAAIQALHPFYNRRTGEVVASWMTKMNREQAIADNIAYVRSSLDQVKREVEVDGPTVFLGFSQGTAMAYRAAGLSGHRCDGMIALAGDMPHELPRLKNYERIPRVLIGRGTEDTWYDDAKLESDVALLQAMGTEVVTSVFEGGHEWTAEFRAAARDFLQEAG